MLLLLEPSFHKFQQLSFGAVQGGQFFGEFDFNPEVGCQGGKKVAQFFFAEAQLIRKESVFLDALEKGFGEFCFPLGRFGYDGRKNKTGILVSAEKHVWEKRSVVTGRRLGREEGVDLPGSPMFPAGFFDAL
jgi:hypothetical protein